MASFSSQQEYWMLKITLAAKENIKNRKSGHLQRLHGFT